VSGGRAWSHELQASISILTISISIIRILINLLPSMVLALAKRKAIGASCAALLQLAAVEG
jgi:hypothetical protein